MSYELMPDLIPMSEVHDALRLINQHIWKKGLRKEDIDFYSLTANWFPYLTEEPEFAEITERWQGYFDLEGDPVWTQIVLQFPVDPNTPSPPWHVDMPPPVGKYAFIAGVCLTESDFFRGGIRFESDAGHVHRFNPGDAFVFTGDTSHSGGLNLSGHIRYAVYMRYLTNA